MKTKFRIYAVFQFMSFVALSSLLVATILLVYQGAKTSVTVEDAEFWKQSIKDTLIFTSSTTQGVMASFFMYATLVLWSFTWIVGWMLLSIKQRNLFDSLFLLFLMLPVVSNLFALFAQMSLKETDYTSASIDKKEIKEETKKLIEEAAAKRAKK